MLKGKFGFLHEYGNKIERHLKLKTFSLGIKLLKNKKDTLDCTPPTRHI